LLANNEYREKAFDLLAAHYKDAGIEAVAGLDARGFIFGTALAQRLSCSFVMIRKPSKLPNTISIDYDLEYGSNRVEIQKDQVKGLTKVLVVDDLLATGGTAIAACALIEKAGGKPIGVTCLIELDGLSGADRIEKAMQKHGVKVFCPIKFDAGNPVAPPVPQTLYRPLKAIPNGNDRRVIVFSHPSMDIIADDICNKYSTQYRRGVIRWGKFPDGYHNIQFEHMDELEGRHVVFLGSLYDPGKLLEQLSMTMVLPRQLVQSLNIVIPYFGPATMERVEEEGTLATAETTARIISSCLPTTRSGPAILRIFDIHALPVRFYFTDNVIVKLMSMVPELLKHIEEHRMTIAFPDEGAFKRFKTAFKGVPTVICAKVRDGDKRIIKITDRANWPQDDGKCMDHILIVDDLVQSGGTLDECRRALVELGAKKISAFVVHPVFPNEGYKKFTAGGEREGFENFFVTNTIPEVASKLKNLKPFTVLDLNDVLAENILRQLGLPSTKQVATVGTVYVASSKPSKLEATRRAFNNAKLYNSDTVRFNTQIYSVPVKSGVLEQPLTKEETEQGALNRLKSLIAEAKAPNNDTYYVAFENGLIKENDVWVDKCCVAITTAKDITKIETAWSEGVTFPKEHGEIIEKVINSKGTVTAGSLLEAKLGLLSDSWHEEIAGKDRITIMEHALRQITGEAI
jgi:adenine phosphoribosyltransferase